jgi:hypothetical protein
LVIHASAAGALPGEVRQHWPVNLAWWISLPDA